MVKAPIFSKQALASLLGKTEGFDLGYVCSNLGASHLKPYPDSHLKKRMATRDIDYPRKI